MNAAERFLDINVLLYLLSGDSTVADRAEAELAAGGVVRFGSRAAFDFRAKVVTKQKGQPVGWPFRGIGGCGDAIWNLFRQNDPRLSLREQA